MAFNYTRFKTRIGKVLGGFNEVNTYRGTTLGTRVTTIAALFGVANPNGDLLTDIYTQQDSADQAMNSWVSYLGQFTESVIGAELDNDLPMVDTSLSNRITELVRRMTADAQTMAECPCTVTVASVGSPTGNPTFVPSRFEYTGRISDYMIPDTLLVKCTGDRSQGGTAFGETFSITGQPADQLPTDASYPSGTSLSTSLTMIDPANSGGLVTDGGFNNTSGSNFTSWTLGTGCVWNTHVFQGADDPRDGASGKCLRLKGDGVVLIKVRQQIQSKATGVYTAHMRLKKVNDPGTDWAVSLYLVDSAGTTIAGPAAFPNSLASLACTSITADWLNVVSGEFVLPAVLPSAGVFLEVRFHQSGAPTTAPVNLAEVYVDHISVNEKTPLYAGGFGLTGYSGTLESVVGDTRTTTVALVSGTISSFVIRGLDRLIGLATLTPRIPTTTSGAATIADSIIS